MELRCAILHHLMRCHRYKTSWVLQCHMSQVPAALASHHCDASASISLAKCRHTGSGHTHRPPHAPLNHAIEPQPHGSEASSLVPGLCNPLGCQVGVENAPTLKVFLRFWRKRSLVE